MHQSQLTRLRFKLPHSTSISKFTMSSKYFDSAQEVHKFLGYGNSSPVLYPIAKISIDSVFQFLMTILAKCFIFIKHLNTNSNFSDSHLVVLESLSMSIFISLKWFLAKINFVNRCRRYENVAVEYSSCV